MNGNSNMYYIGGSKGGVDKTLLSFVPDRLSSEPETERPTCGYGHRQPGRVQGAQRPRLTEPALSDELPDDADGRADLLNTMQGALRKMQRELVIFLGNQPAARPHRAFALAPVGVSRYSHSRLPQPALRRTRMLRLIQRFQDGGSC